MDHSFISNARLKNHQLLDSGFATPKEIVSWMGAMQAQDFNMAKWAIGARMSHGTEQTVADAFNQGKILRTHILRPTWHFVVPEDIRWMLSLNASKIIASMKSRDRDLGLNAEVYSKSYGILEKALEGNKHLTREKLYAAFEKNGFPINSSQFYHIMMHAESNGLVCSGAMHQKSQTYALLEERVLPAKFLHREEALAKLAEIYFRSHGPATLPDFVWWSGLSAAEAKNALELVKPLFVAEIIDSQTYWWLHASQNNSPKSDLFHLLPAFDEYIVGYRCRKAVLPFENYNQAISSNGMFRPTILKNGQVIGIWKKTVSKTQLLSLDFFDKSEKFSGNSMDAALEHFKVFGQKNDI